MRLRPKLKRFAGLRQAYAAGLSARLNAQAAAQPSPSLGGEGRGEGETNLKPIIITETSNEQQTR